MADAKHCAINDFIRSIILATSFSRRHIRMSDMPAKVQGENTGCDPQESTPSQGQNLQPVRCKLVHFWLCFADRFMPR
jgi:hypothetical protein